MPVNLSVKDVPDHLADALRERARANHRSLQGELMFMIEAHVGGRPFKARELWEQVRAMGLRTKAEAIDVIRAERNQR